MIRFRQFLFQASVGFAACTAATLLHFVYHLPTSDYRARIYTLLYAFPIEIGGIYFGALLLVAAAAILAAGWRGWIVLGSAALAALAALAILYSGVLSATVWLHEDEVTRGGRLGRAVIALVLAWLPIHTARVNLRVSGWAKARDHR